ncbi:DUF1254 domain-containing protein [Minwuia sp.]|uniref:DUF1254 domain-containing protein n=1 Tax=Minwuia sp. TaxID=2493630 RepID=UPI003A92E81E
MQLRQAGRWIGFTLLFSAIVHVGTVWLIPQMTMRGVLERTGDAAGYNRLVHMPLASAESRIFPRPAPAVATSFCAYDLLNGPVRVSIPPTAATVSINGYSDRTDNFLSVSGSAANNGWQGVLTFSGTGDGQNAIVAPDRKGVIMVRRLMRAGDDRDAMVQERAAMVCEPTREASR